MKALIFVGFLGALFLSASCATTARYDAKVVSWKGHPASELRAWGQPDSTEKLSSGNEMYVYARLKHEPLAYNEAHRADRMIASVGEGSPTYIKCATYFEVNPDGRVVGAIFRGDECKSRD